MTEETFQNEALRLRPKLTAVARRYTDHEADAEDIVQDALLKLWLMHDDLQSPPDGLAVVLTRNLSINHQRRKKPHYPTLDVADEDTTEDDRIERMMRVIDTLPIKQQIILRLRHMDGMSIRDIATLTAHTEAAVRKILSRARQEVMGKVKNPP